MSNRTAVIAVLLVLAAVPATAADEEGCLFCHRLPIRAGTALGAAEYRVSDPPSGPHAALFCSDCHPDAKTSPHASPPGSARCNDACHGGTAEATESHRKASFGGLTESHRSVAGSGSPCRLCHRMDDPAGRKEVVSRRCAACHPVQSGATASGVHKSIGEGGPGSACTSCHSAHFASGPGDPGRKGITCDGPRCHARVTERMRGHGGHGGPSGGSAGRAGKVAVFLVVAISAIAPGVLFRLGRFRRGDAP